MTRLALLDRDGTINAERHYLRDPDELELLPGAVEGIRLLRESGFRVVVVTNQSAIGRGMLDWPALERIHERLGALLSAQGAWLDAIYVCPHRPEDGCDCRKPAPGLAERAAREFEAELRHAVVIGDKPCDVQFGKAIGATTILVQTGYGAAYSSEEPIQPDHVAADLTAAARWILANLELTQPHPWRK